MLYSFVDIKSASADSLCATFPVTVIFGLYTTVELLEPAEDSAEDERAVDTDTPALDVKLDVRSEAASSASA